MNSTPRRQPRHDSATFPNGYRPPLSGSMISRGRHPQIRRRYGQRSNSGVALTEPLCVPAASGPTRVPYQLVCAFQTLAPLVPSPLPPPPGPHDPCAGSVRKRSVQTAPIKIRGVRARAHTRQGLPFCHYLGPMRPLAPPHTLEKPCGKCMRRRLIVKLGS